MIQIHAACIALPAGQIFFIAQGGAGVCDIQCIAVLDGLTRLFGRIALSPNWLNVTPSGFAIGI